jgi:hypothetical protein
MAYLVLSQIAQRPGGQERYRDVEGSLYHYPRQYFSLIEGFEAFVYYRPIRNAPRGERSSYVGYGRLLDWFADPTLADHRYVRIADYRPFTCPVSFAEPGGRFYESPFFTRNAFQGRAVRKISSVDFTRILVAAGLRGDPLASLGNVDDAASAFDPLMLDRFPRSPPRQPLVTIVDIPDGAGYIATGRQVDLLESAGLQERARADHQRLLRALHRMGVERGAASMYNNNIDLLLMRPGENVLVEAKSLNDDRDSVDRMRYGMGQLLDYGVRYRAEIAGAKPLLAFGRIPANDAGWISEILQQNGIGFAGLSRGDVLPLNAAARETFLFR